MRTRLRARLAAAAAVAILAGSVLTLFATTGPAVAFFSGGSGTASAPEVGGLSKGQEVRSGGPLVLLYSTDLDRSVEAVQHAGGQVVNGPYAFPGGRRFHFTDPSGNELGVWAEA